MTQFAEFLDDTSLEIGSEEYASALVVYNAAKTHGQVAGLEEALDDLSRRFTRKTKKSE